MGVHDVERFFLVQFDGILQKSEIEAIHPGEKIRGSIGLSLHTVNVHAVHYFVFSLTRVIGGHHMHFHTGQGQLTGKSPDHASQSANNARRIFPGQHQYSIRHLNPLVISLLFARLSLLFGSQFLLIRLPAVWKEAP